MLRVGMTTTKLFSCYGQTLSFFQISDHKLLMVCQDIFGNNKCVPCNIIEKRNIVSCGKQRCFFVVVLSNCLALLLRWWPAWLPMIVCCRSVRLQDAQDSFGVLTGLRIVLSCPCPLPPPPSHGPNSNKLLININTANTKNIVGRASVVPLSQTMRQCLRSSSLPGKS